MNYIKSYRNIIRERKHEMSKLTQGYKSKKDINFESICDSYLSGNIEIDVFNSYLDDSLFLNIPSNVINESFDNYGNIIKLNESWFSDIGDKIKQKWNIAEEFFKNIINKVVTFIKGYLKITDSNREKIMDMISSFYEKIMSGLKLFGDFLKKNKKGLYTLLTKISISLGISFTLSAILSYFGAGWVTFLGTKAVASEITGSKIGKRTLDKVANKVVNNEPKIERIIQDYKTFLNEEQESTTFKVGKAIGKGLSVISAGMIKFFKILRRFKIALLILLGVVWLLDAFIFSPLSIFEPIIEAANMKNFSDVFSEAFIVSSTLPKVDIESISDNVVIQPNTEKIGAVIKSVSLDNQELETSAIDDNISVGLSNSVNSVKSNIIDNPQAAGKNAGHLINQLLPQASDDNVSIKNVTTTNAQELTEDDYKLTTGNNDLDNMKAPTEQEIADRFDNNPSDELIRLGEHKPTAANELFDKIYSKMEEEEQTITELREKGDWSGLKELYLKVGYIKDNDGQYYTINKDKIIFPDNEDYENYKEYTKNGAPLELSPEFYIEKKTELITLNNTTNGVENSKQIFATYTFQETQEGPFKGDKSFLLRLNYQDNEVENSHVYMFHDGQFMEMIGADNNEYDVDPEKIRIMVKNIFGEDVAKKIDELKVTKEVQDLK